MSKRNEKTSERIAKIAAVGLRHPDRLSLKDIQDVCGSVLTQKEKNEEVIEAIVKNLAEKGENGRQTESDN